MPRNPSEYRAVHAAADSIEPRLARAIAKAFGRAQERISINDLALALARRDQDGAERIIFEALEDVLAPAGTIVRDAVLKGGKIGAGMVRG